MALLHPKQLAQASAVTGQPIVWSGSVWGPGNVTGASGVPRFETDSTGDLSSLTTLWSYHPLGEVRGVRADLMGRVPLSESGNPPAVIGGGPSSQEMSVLDISTGNYLTNSSVVDWWATTTPFSVSFWFYCDTFGSDGDYRCLVSRNTTTAGGGWAFFIQRTGADTNLTSNFWSAAGAGDELRHTVALSTATWYHCGFAFDGTNRRLYLNAANEATDAPTVTPGAADSATLFYVGRKNDTNVYAFDGRICHLAMWRNTGLASARITELYGAGTPNRLRL